MSGLTCEVICVLNVKAPIYFRRCDKPVAYFAKGCVGAVEGKAFVCEEHKNHYAPRMLLTISDYWIQEAEKSL